ncbi:MAG: F0F1 ATP synthase subunit delta [Deltaproteobacteria bacterium]|nr:F0F1 ATP synthase subunit delta [Deltaproteobacteria bacterium]
MTGGTLAKRYAKALFSLGEKSGAPLLEQYGADLAGLAEMVVISPALGRMFKSPVVTAAEKRALVDQLLDKAGADPGVKNFCRLLADKGRLAALPAIAACYGELLDAAKGVLRGTVVTAVSLNAEKQKKLKADLAKKTKSKKLELVFTVDESILGGLMLKVGDRVLDASLRAQLTILRDTIKRGE